MRSITPTSTSTIHTLDMNFQGIPGAIAVYLLQHQGGAALVECGPGSTLPALQSGLLTYGLTPADITDVFLTHIHLDHGGAAGWLARQGARIHVHPVGAPHLINPEKLLTSAGRIYGDRMEQLWGEFLPVPEDQLHVLEDNQVVEMDGLRVQAINTPGHAYHHYAYILNDDVLFTGDIGGIRVGGIRHLRLPAVPPEFNLELWRQTILRLQSIYEQGGFQRLAPTHFGIYDDPAWHLNATLQALDEIEAWMLEVMPANPSLEDLTPAFINWAKERSLRSGVSPTLIDPLEAANPSGMSAGGIYRYWHKVRNVQA